MKNLVLILLVTFISSASHANCNLKLAVASGNYLEELEKAKLHNFQGGGACKVLDMEYKKCTKQQQTFLAKSVNLREVLGNICMPHLPPATK